MFDEHSDKMLRARNVPVLSAIHRRRYLVFREGDALLLLHPRSELYPTLPPIARHVPETSRPFSAILPETRACRRPGKLCRITETGSLLRGRLFTGKQVAGRSRRRRHRRRCRERDKTREGPWQARRRCTHKGSQERKSKRRVFW